MVVFLMISLIVTSLFLILLILIQRGKGGGLAGAFGGMGGQSAFGTKAGDTFTRITIGVATFWFLLCITTVLIVGRPSGPMKLGDGISAPASSSGAEAAPASGGTGTSPSEDSSQ